MDALWGLLANLVFGNDEIIREVMNGMWFILCAEIWLSLIYYIYLRATKEPAKPRQIWVHPEPWYRELGTQLAVAWAFLIAGSAIRAGWIWVLLECQNRLGREKCHHVIATAEWLYLASFLAIVGGTWTMARMLPEEWGKRRWIVPPVVALIIPLVVNVLN